jgi:hypothetical protein
MTTYKAKETAESIAQGWLEVHEAIKAGGKLLIQVTHTSKSNLSYRYSVRLAYTDTQGEVTFRNLAYLIGATTGESIVSRFYGDELKGHGVGTDRFFLCAYEIGLMMKAQGLISDAYEIATRRIYKEI